MRKQRGVTTIGWIFLLAPIAVVLYGGIRAVPEYLNYYKVLKALKETATALKSEEVLTPVAIRAAIERRFDTGYVYSPKPSEIGVVKADEGWTMTADYETTVPMFGNLYLTMAFNESVVIN